MLPFIHMPHLLRILFALALALFTEQASGIASVQVGDECGERCPGDAPDGTCPPDCQFCACCSLPRVLAPQPAASVPAPTAHRFVQVSRDSLPNSPEPADILHVPKFSRVAAT
jgi:hypothetical protein